MLFALAMASSQENTVFVAEPEKVGVKFIGLCSGSQ